MALKLSPAQKKLLAGLRAGKEFHQLEWHSLHTWRILKEFGLIHRPAGSAGPAGYELTDDGRNIEIE